MIAGLNWLLRISAVVAVVFRFRQAVTEEILTPQEEASLRSTLGDALRADGTVDFDLLEEWWSAAN